MPDPNVVGVAAKQDPSALSVATMSDPSTWVWCKTLGNNIDNNKSQDYEK
jgi:hypothetical protein